MADLTDFIQVQEGALPNETCKFLIDLFEQNPEQQNIVEVDGKKCYTEINLTKISGMASEIKEIHNSLIRDVFRYRDEYYETYNRSVFPENHAFEQFKIKRYDPIDEFGNYTHVDVLDHETSRRYLSFLWFLSDNEAGQLEFLDLIIQPKCGKLVIFPPLWLFPYREIEPVKTPKYILTTYLHYK